MAIPARNTRSNAFDPCQPSRTSAAQARDAPGKASGEWQDLDRGHVLHSAGDPPDSVEAVVRGELEETRKGRVLGHARPGDLAGLASMLGGSLELYDVTVTRPARIMRWRQADLQRYAGVDESLTSALRKIAGAALAQKLILVVQAEG